MPTLYLDIFSGISGDMFLGAVLDLGIPLETLQRELQKLPVHGYHLHARRASKSGIEGIKLDVHLDHEHDSTHSHDAHHGHTHRHEHSGDHSHSHSHSHSHGHSHADPAHDHAHGRSYADIRAMLEKSSLDAWVRTKAVAVFHRLALAEGKIHGKPADSVHFHEVGAIDSIVDITGACLALDALGRPRVRAGMVVDGTGFVRCAHGRMPLPAPATLEVFAARGIAITQCPEPHELITPTGAALLAEFAESFGPLPAGFAPQRVGYGLGTRENHTRPNLLRAVLGEEKSSPTPPGPMDWETDEITVLETNLDDVSGEILGHVLERAFAAGALDAFHTPIQMKKHRPGTLFTILCDAPLADALTELLLRETSAFGVRRTSASRRKLRRTTRSIATPFGPVDLKEGWLNGARVQAAPEFESCRALAIARGVPVKAVFDAARLAAGL